MKKYYSYKVYPKEHHPQIPSNSHHVNKQLYPLANRKKPETSELHGKYGITAPISKTTNTQSKTTSKEAQPFKLNKSNTKVVLPMDPKLSKIMSQKNLRIDTRNPNSPRQPHNIVYGNMYKAPRSPRGNLGMNSPKSDHAAYANLSEKINDIAGKLHEMKKEHQLAKIQKKNDKNRYYSPLEVGKTMGVLSPMNSSEKENLKNLYNYANKNHFSGKEGIVKDRPKSSTRIPSYLISKQASELRETTKNQNIKLKQDKSKSTIVISKLGNTHQKPKDKKLESEKLSQYVTTYNPEPATGKHLKQCTSQINIFKPQTHSQKHKDHFYYVSSIVKAFMTNRPNSFDELCRNHVVSSLEILTYMKDSNVISKSLSNPCKSLKSKAPPSKQSRPITIIFDLDETLIHCNESTKMPCDIVLPIKFPENATIKAGVNIRPYATQCLKELSKYFQLMVFTASHEFYANVIINHLDPKGEYISHRMFRDSCHKTQQGFYVKDLRVVDRDLSNVLLIDNAAYSYGFQPENGVPIIPFYDNKADLQLKSLVPYLKSFLNESDVRRKNSQTMGIQRYTSFKTADGLINQLYL